MKKRKLYNIAFMGDKDHGCDIISTLESWGGSNHYLRTGSDPEYAYFINDLGTIDFIHNSALLSEEMKNFYFLFWYDYNIECNLKVGETINYGGQDYDVDSILFDANNMCIVYKLKSFGIGEEYITNNELTPTEEWQTEEENNKYLNKDNKEMNQDIETNQCKVNGLKRGDEYPIMEGVECNKCVKYYFPEGYEFVDTDDTGIYLKPIKPKYPKTYKEYCDVLGVTVEKLSDFIFKNFRLTVTHTSSNSNEYYINLFKNFFELKLCYDAYRKIAGEEMGLGKPWEPSWQKTEESKFCIIRRNDNVVTKWETKTIVRFLAFPTEEMRDTFYQNFKDLIEQCKELL